MTSGTEPPDNGAPLQVGRPLGAVGLLDAAWELSRRQPLDELFRAWLPGALILWCALSLFYLERVEGIRSLRPAFAVALTLAWLLRSWALSRWAGRRSRQLLEHVDVPIHSGPLVDTLRTGLWVGAGLWLWLWLLVMPVQFEPLASVPPVLLLLGMRGAVAPGWMARADEAQGGSGLKRLLSALGDTEGQRVAGWGAETLMLLGGIALFANLASLGAMFVLLGQSLLGMHLALVSAFLSTDNHFALMTAAGTSLVMLEPLRASLSALVHTQALMRRQGLDVRALVQRCVQQGARRGALRVAAAVCLSTVATGAWASPARAQQDAPPPCESDACELARVHDVDADMLAHEILKQPAYQEFPNEEWDLSRSGDTDALERWLRRLSEWLDRWVSANDESEDWQTRGLWSNVSLPSGVFFMILAAVLVALAISYLWNRSNGGQDDDSQDDEAGGEDPLSQDPDAHLQQAAQLAQQSDLRQALRSLYLATLVALDRRDRIRFSPERTNGQYLRAMPRGTEREAFAQFTRIFDHSWYGGAAPSQEHYATCRRLAEQLCGPPS